MTKSILVSVVLVATAAFQVRPQTSQTHVLKLLPENVHWGYYDPALKPVLRVASGEFDFLHPYGVSGSIPGKGTLPDEPSWSTAPKASMR